MQTRSNYWGWISTLFAALAAGLLFLWWTSGGQFIVKSLTENYNILLAAANVHDWRTFIVQDVAASSDPAAHPYWYIHHPNLFPKAISLFFSQLGFNLEGAVLIQLGLSTLSLALVISSLARFSSAAALGALFIAATSYGSFYFAAGDLARGPNLLIVCLLLTVLLRNNGLQSTGYNLATAFLSAAAMLSDWGLAVFVMTFAFCWAAFDSGRVRWGWFFAYVAAPSVLVFLIYEAAVIDTVGWDFFLFDARVTYLGRLGTGSALDYRDAIETFRNHNVIIWPPQGLGLNTLLQFIAALVIMPLLNTGPAWLLLMPISLAAAVHIVGRMRISLAVWCLIGVVVVANVAHLAPMVVVGPAIFLFGIHLGRASSRRATTALCGLVTCVILGLAAAASLFPAFTMGFTMASGRAPFPLLEMTAAATFMHAVSMHVGVRLLRLPPRTGGFSWRMVVRGEGLLVGVVLLTLLAVLLSSGAFFGVPKVLAAGLALAAGGGSLVLGNLLSSHIRPNNNRTAWSALIHRWQIPLVMVIVTSVLAYHKSASPTIMGRYSAGYLALLSMVVVATVASFILTLWPQITAELLRKINRISAPLSGPLAVTGNRAASAITFVAAFFAIGQAAWFLLSVAASPPGQVPYAAELKKPEYSGKTFLSTSFEGIAWYYTKGSASMTPTNPPPRGPLNPRFRHYADWKNGRKYNYPDYFLCDNTGLAFVRPGTSLEPADKPPTTCSQCTCRDSAAVLKAEGHSVVVDRPDFSIVRFDWKSLRE